MTDHQVEAFAQFEGFDWDNHEGWLAFRQSITLLDDATPSLLKVKHKWFKKNINPHFDPSFKPTPPKDTQKQSDDKPSGEKTPEATQTTANSPRLPILKIIILILNLAVVINALFAIINMFTSVFLGQLHALLVYANTAASYFILLCQALGRPQMNMQYLLKLVGNDNMHYILYSMIFIAAKPFPIAILPISIYACINVSILLPRCLSSFGISPAPVQSLLDLVKSNKTRLLAVASNFEVSTFIALFVNVVSGEYSMLLQMMLYWNFLTQRYNSSSWTQSTVMTLEKAADSFLLSPKSPSIIQAGYYKLKQVIKFLSRSHASRG